MREALIIGATTFVLLGALEVGSRVAFPRVCSWECEPAYQFHPDYLVALKPEYRGRFKRSSKNGGQTISWKTNQYGFRGDPLRTNPTMRVLIYGDSNVQAVFSKLEDTFPFKLEAELSDLMQRDFEVINGGVVGFGPDQSLIRFSLEADIYQPAIVIFHVFAENDFGDLIRNRLFEINAEGYLIRTPYPITEDAYLKRALEPGLIASSGLFRMATEVGRQLQSTNNEGTQQESAEKIIKNFQSWCEGEFAIYRDQKPRAASHFSDHYDFDVAIDPSSEAAQAKTRLMAAILTSAKNLAASKEIMFLVVIQPSRIDLTRNFVVSFLHLSRYPNYKSSNLTEAISDICWRNELKCLNLFPIFESNDPESLYFKGADDHWNNEGQALAARVTAAYLADMISRHTADNGVALSPYYSALDNGE